MGSAPQLTIGEVATDEAALKAEIEYIRDMPIRIGKLPEIERPVENREKEKGRVAISAAVFEDKIPGRWNSSTTKIVPADAKSITPLRYKMEFRGTINQMRQPLNICQAREMRHSKRKMRGRPGTKIVGSTRTGEIGRLGHVGRH